MYFVCLNLFECIKMCMMHLNTTSDLFGLILFGTICVFLISKCDDIEQLEILIVS